MHSFIRGMSCRPRGPSDRPLYYLDDLELAGNQAPRLPAQSLASRLLLAGVLVCCCGIAAFSLLFALSLASNLPHMPIAASIVPGASIVAIEQLGDAATAPASAPMPTHRAQRNVLARMGMLKRAPGHAHGADDVSLRMVFPHWFPEEGVLDPRAALADVALALSYLSQEDARNRS